MIILLSDTICALSTAVGESAIAVIRISGNDSFVIVNKIFKGQALNQVESHRTVYGKIYDYENNQQIDEVLLVIFKGKKSFTGENTVEINCHGGIFIVRKILNLLVKNGARLAEKGEFSKRAFLNGKIDLTKAEGIMDIISAKTEMSLKVANQGLAGDIYQMINDLKSQLLDIIGIIEVNIDYPEYDDVELLTAKILIPKINKLLKTVNNILEKSEIGILMKQGLKTAIIGKPNVGKSSILNALLDDEKAIVTDIAGTTRDIVEGDLTIKGIQIKLLDTAGIRETVDAIEKIGIAKTRTCLKEADLVLLILDYSSELNDTEKELISFIHEMKHLIVINKIDKDKKIDCDFENNSVYISVLKEKGIEKLKEEIGKFASVEKFDKDLIYLSNIRQITKLEEVSKELNAALNSANDSMPTDIISIDLQEAFFSLNEILGIHTTEDLIDQMFSRFCLGK